jgi:PKD repeat protein
VYNRSCTDARINFEVEALGSITWFFGAGAQPVSASGPSVDVKYTTTGRKTVTALVNGRSYTFSQFINIQNVGVNLQPNIVSTADTICVGQQPNFTSQFAADSFRWQIIDIAGVTDYITTSPSLNSHIFSQTGNAQVILRTETACCGISDPDTFAVFVRPNPAPFVEITSLNNSNEGCVGEPFTFEARTLNVGLFPTYVWNINGINVPGNNSPVLTRTNFQTGDVIGLGIVVFSECLNGDTVFSNDVTLVINDNPTLQPFGNGACIQVTGNILPGQPIEFEANGVSSTGSPLTYFWDFGDGTAGGVGNPVTHIFNDPGAFSVTVYAQDANGCRTRVNAALCGDVTPTGEAIVPIEIDFFVKADFSANTFIGCAPLEVDFTNQSLYAISYLWSFGDGNSSNQIDPTHTYTAAGVYDVTLFAFGSSTNDTATKTFQVIVTPTPTADIVAYPLPVTNPNDSVVFASSSFGASQWRWDFGDGNTSTEPNPSHYYANEGDYTVTLIVSNAYGCSDTIVKQNFVRKEVINLSTHDQLQAGLDVRIYPNPFADFFRLELQVAAPGNIDIRLSDLTGRLIIPIETLTLAPGLNQFDYQLTDQPAGIYILQLSFGGSTWSYKLVRTN